MIRPRRLWPLYERFLRSVAGLGRVDERGGHARRYDTEHRRVDVLVVGGGSSGRRAAAEASRRGRSVLLVDDQADSHEEGGYEVLAPARAIGIYEGGLVPVDAGDVLYRIRAGRIVVATGTIEQPLVFPGNDLVGVMLPTAVRRLVDEWSISPGHRAVVIGTDDRALAVTEQLERAGVDVAEVVDLRETSPALISAAGRRGHVRSLSIDGRTHECDLLVASGVRQPAYSLLAQAGARVEYDAARGVFVPTELPPGVEAAGSVAGDLPASALPAASYGGAAREKCFVCICEDVTEKDVEAGGRRGLRLDRARQALHDRDDGAVPGQALPPLLDPADARKLTETDETAIGTTTARPPWQPVELGLLAGRHYEPLKRTPMHFRHEQAGATMMWTGAWQRPFAYGDPAAEVRAVHDGLGVIDVSTLGKILVEGPDAGALLERLYPNRFADLAVGRIRYGVLTTDAGRIMDDGTVARLADDLFYVTTTSTGSDSVCEWFEWWNAVWGYDAEIVNVTGALAALNIAGPRRPRGARRG